MNFGKRATNRKRNALASHSTMMGKKANVSILRIIFIALIAVLAIGCCMGIGAMRGLIDDAPDISEVNIVPVGEATFVYDANGDQLQKLTAPDSNRMPVTIDQIPLDLQHAVVAIEDERFYEHNGIDIRGILRAGVVGITTGHFSEGASTITQQLIKNNVFTDWVNESTLERFERKFQEWYLALELEKQIKDKDVILQNYLNTINLGNGNYGVQAAAQDYFGKDVSDLTLSECTVLAGITQNPTKYNPVINPENNAKRRQEVLDHMLDQEYITKEQYDECLADNVYERIQSVEKESESENTTYSYFIDELTEQVIQDLQDKRGYSEQQAYNALYSGGLRIYTTQDPSIQQICDEEYSDPDNFPSGSQVELDYALTLKHANGEEENYSTEMLEQYFIQNESSDFTVLFNSQESAQAHVDAYKAAVMTEGDEVVAETVHFTPQPQSSLCIIDQHTGYVKAIVGGRGEKSSSLSLNRATNTTRQPGSTFKPLAAYAAALNECGMSLATTFEDEPFTYDNGEPLYNADRQYHGTVTMREAIVHSYNIPAVKCMIEITPELGVEYLQKFGFTTLITEPTEINGGIYDDVNASTAIGGITQGVSNLELTAAYATIANNGTYIKPVFYTKILDADGNVVIDNSPEKTTVIKPSTAYLLTNVMEDVVTEGTGTRVQFDGMHIAGKTGTTDNYRDLWFCGFTPYYTCSVWAGYDDNTVLPQGTYRTYQQTLWRNIMQRIHADLPDTDFKMPSTVQKASICTQTGLLATSSCNAVTEYFDIDQIPTQYCSGHYSYHYNYNYDYSYDYSEDSGTDSSEDSNTTVEEPTPETPAEVPEETQPEVSVPEESTETPPADGGTDTGGGEAPADTGGEVAQ
ncbi:MAG TPA: PBP1A family penicillin-binding protein [Candidatus Blautia stercorigallinarum]|uniref:Penicillin-binding protein 1A n=1 Tax=Candidatus Blautia stercorigallinarum TaxID=2838501 RepID=A0A9D1TFS7_9FIRM|nr:PBP1A family penicillin-binding protein [Candidatus Blautia stercorigallinarum]